MTPQMIDSQLAQRRRVMGNIMGDQAQQKRSTSIVPCFVLVEVSVGQINMLIIRILCISSDLMTSTPPLRLLWLTTDLSFLIRPKNLEIQLACSH